MSEFTNSNELYETIGPSVKAAFNWLLDVEYFADGTYAGIVETEDEISLVYQYALDAGLSEREVDQLYEAALGFEETN